MSKSFCGRGDELILRRVRPEEVMDLGAVGVCWRGVFVDTQRARVIGNEIVVWILVHELGKSNDEHRSLDVILNETSVSDINQC